MNQKSTSVSYRGVAYLQLGLVRRESERQRLMREDMEMELQALKNHTSVMQAALDEASARTADDVLEAQLARQEAERLHLTDPFLPQ